MPCILQTIHAGASLRAIERRIHEAEDGTFFELVSLSGATVGGVDVNVITLRSQPAHGRLVLVEIDGAGALARQELQVCAGRAGDRGELVSYGAVWVAGRRANVAAYRVNADPRLRLGSESES